MKFRFISTVAFLILFLTKRAYAQNQYHLPHFADGSFGTASFRTTFILFNNSDANIAATLNLTDDNGNPLATTLGALGTGSQFIINLEAGVTAILQTDGSGAGTSGAATITSNMPIGASAIFTVLDSQGQFQSEAGVGDSPVLTSLTLPVDITGNFDTGVAFFNPGGSAIILTLKLLDANGILVNSATQSLGSKNHLVTFVDNLFPGISNFRGSLAVSATGGVAATTLRQYGSGVTYTTLPTASGTASGKAQPAPLLSQTITGIDAIAGDPDVALSVTLPEGRMISGIVSGAGQGLQVIASAGGSDVFVSAVNPLTGNYLIVVPGGTYRLTTCYLPAGTSYAAPVTVTYADPNAVSVSIGGTVRDIALPSVALSNVSGTVSGLSGPPSGAIPTIAFTSTDNKTQGRFSLDDRGNYQGFLLAGNYVASIAASPIQFLPLQNESLQLYNLGSLTVGGGPVTHDYAIPATAKLSGTISGGG